MIINSTPLTNVLFIAMACKQCVTLSKVLVIVCDISYLLTVPVACYMF